MPSRASRSSVRGGLPVDTLDTVVSAHSAPNTNTTTAASVRHPGRPDPHQAAHPLPGQSSFVGIFGRLWHGIGAAALVVPLAFAGAAAATEGIGETQNRHIRLLVGVALGIVLGRGGGGRAKPVPVTLLQQPLLAEAGILAHVVPIVAVYDQRVDVRTAVAAAAATAISTSTDAAHALDTPR